MSALQNFSLMPCNWGVQPAKPEDFIALAKDAERLGYYAVGMPHLPLLPYAEERPPEAGSQIWTHLPRQYKDYQFDSLALVPMMAQATSRIRIGFNVLVLPWLHPFVWAKYLASLDAATNGRVIAGFGLSVANPATGKAKNLDNFGIDGKQRGAMADEALECLARLWTSDELVSFEGKFYKGVDLAVVPKPVQKPYPEIWWAGHLKVSITRAARYAKYLELSVWSLPGGTDAFTAIRERYVPGLAEANAQFGGDAKVQALVYVNVLDKDIPGDELTRRYWGWRPPISDSLVVGSAERVASIIRKFKSAGVAHFVLDFQRHGLESITYFREQMDRFVKEVVPLLD
jgi:alkanesulfonate monooxygenase SsuD/methylene tetrahydromethanopterin reductase-like flavin-dependent oxidoreductase (luciferase family)